jgi:hypothetical protein
MLPELFNCSSRGILPEVHFVYNLVACPFGELIFLTHVLKGIRVLGLEVRGGR